MPYKGSSILVVEDDAVIRELLVSYFEAEGYVVTALDHADDAIETILDRKIEICLIDIALPGMDGLTLTREIRSESKVGIILVTSKDDIVDRIVGLESGADDYVIKPFDLRELHSRLKNVLRRTYWQKASPQLLDYAFCGWKLNNAKRNLTAPHGEIVKLSQGEFSLLLALLQNPGVSMSRDELTNKIRNREWNPEDRYIDTLVVRLRKKFSRYSPDEVFITTVHGQGYMFEHEPTFKQ